MTDLTALADTLDRAACESRPVPQLPPENSISLDEAYQGQARVVASRLARGERLVGLKISLTSEAKMRQVGVGEVILGRLTDAMQVEDGGFIDLGRMIHPRVEPEIAFLLRRPLPPRSGRQTGRCDPGGKFRYPLAADRRGDGPSPARPDQDRGSRPGPHAVPRRA